MDFGSILSVAQKNTKTVNHSSERSKFYSTKFEPPKKETKEKKLSDGIKKFLEQKSHEEKKDKEKKRKEYAELMALRTDRDKNKIKKHLKVTKSANKSVLDDAVNSTDTAVTMEGPEQPDEDDYGYTSNEASALYKSLMDKYKSMPEDTKFAKSSLNGSKTADLMSTKDRVRAAILREKEDEKLGRKRTTTTSADISSSSSSEQKHRSRKNFYDPKAEREADERRKKELEDEKRKSIKNKRPPPPVMDFQKLLKLAEEKQHEPIKVEVPQKPKEPERLLTSKEKREIEMKKKELEERERRRMGLPPSKPQINGEQRKPEATQIANGRIPRLNGSNAPSSKSSSSQPALDIRKPSTSSMREPIRPVSSASLHNKTPSKPQSQPSASGSRPTFAKPSTSQPYGKRPVDLKSRNQTHDSTRNVPKQSTSSKPASKPIDSKIVKTREFPPKDLVKPKEFPPRDVARSKEFPPRDPVKSREFPPRDMQRGHTSMKHKSAASKRRIIEDSDEDEDEYDSEMDDFIDDDEGFDYSSEIRNIFGYDKSRYRDEDDDIDNMESTFAQQQREEFISKKIGIQEDLEDIRLEAEEKKRKAAKRQRL
ncbi:protein SPT2 homolog [Sitodiplosis mosellana]|uniref:protein SPT2 homolog n=1 Tax=Sitodiplosis mosellana TaxID=263140 RepID=UPI002444BAE2|nr:protein SPT2 homolog [Sitodiplosis mosellana]